MHGSNCDCRRCGYTVHWRPKPAFRFWPDLRVGVGIQRAWRRLGAFPGAGCSGGRRPNSVGSSRRAASKTFADGDGWPWPGGAEAGRASTGPDGRAGAARRLDPPSAPRLRPSKRAAPSAGRGGSSRSRPSFLGRLGIAPPPPSLSRPTGDDASRPSLFPLGGGATAGTGADLADVGRSQSRLLVLVSRTRTRARARVDAINRRDTRLDLSLAAGPHSHYRRA